jgi:caffeoyl-CoA O-methyltransferase
VIVRPRIEEYALGHSSPEPAYLTALAAETRERIPEAYMMVGWLEAQFLQMLVHALRPTSLLEIGTFTGYSALALAAAMPPGGRLVTCELNQLHAEIARRHVAASPFSERIEIREGDARETIAALDSSFDFVFIDADKEGYSGYVDAVLPKLRPGGLIAVDNVLWFGRVIADDGSADVRAITSFNDKIRDDPQLEKVVVTVREGITLIRKRAA